MRSLARARGAWQSPFAAFYYPLLRAHAAYAANATRVMAALNAMPDAEVRRLQRGVARVAARLLYRRPPPAAPGEQLDATGVLVERLRRLRLRPAPDERREQERRAAQRAQDAEAEARLLKTVSRSGRRIARA